MRRRICVVLPAHWSATRGGAEYQAKLLVEHLVANYDVEVFYLTTRAASDYRPRGYEIVQFSSSRGIRRYGTFFDAVRLYRALRALRPDIVYQQVGCAHTGIAAFYARRNGCRMVWRVANDNTLVALRTRWWQIHRRIERRVMRYGIENADLVLAQTRAQRRLLADGFGRDDAIVIPNFHPPARELGAVPRPDRKRVVWIANLKTSKNPYAFLRLAERVRARADVEPVMIGATSDATRWTQELLAAIRAASVTYLGGLEQHEVAAVLAGATVLVNTSEHEGFANTFIEAWMHGVPVAALHVDADGLLGEGGLGSVAHGSEQALYADVSRLLDDPDLAARIGARGREHVRAAHSMANVDKLARVLELDRVATPAFEQVAYATP
jgi:glycosyltransferase involved in cell wall biosynthesis